MVQPETTHFKMDPWFYTVSSRRSAAITPGDPDNTGRHRRGQRLASSPGSGVPTACRRVSVGREKAIIFIIWPIACSITLVHTVKLLTAHERQQQSLAELHETHRTSPGLCTYDDAPQTLKAGFALSGNHENQSGCPV